MSIIKPYKGNFRITQRFGETLIDYSKYGLVAHNGIDTAMPVGTPIIAAHAGEVLEVYNDPGYGLYVKIEDTEQGSLYAHLAQTVVKIGFQVKQGQLLGYSGNTGNSTGPHLHFGYYRIPRDRSNGFNGYIDPEPYFLAIGGATVMDGLNTYGLDDTNIASKQVVYDAWYSLTTGKYVLREDTDKIITALNETIKNQTGELNGLKEKFDNAFTFLSELDKKGIKNMDDVNKFLVPYTEMYQAGFANLGEILEKLTIGQTNSEQLAAANVALTKQLEALTNKYNTLELENIQLHTELSSYSGYNKDLPINKIISTIVSVFKALKVRKVTGSIEMQPEPATNSPQSLTDDVLSSIGINK